MRPSGPATLLILDGDESRRKSLAALFEPEGYLISGVGSKEAALDSVAQQLPDLILLSGLGPGSGVLEIIRRLKADPRSRSIPVIFLTAREVSELSLMGLNAGVEELICTSVDPAELLLRVKNLLKLMKYQALPANDNRIPERRVRERNLQASEELLQEALSIAGVGSYVMEIPGGSWESSDVLDDLFGIDKAYQRSAAGWEALIHPDDRPMITGAKKNETIESAKIFDKEYRILRHDNHAERWVQEISKMVFDTSGQLVEVHGTIRDITERKLLSMEASLKAKQSGILFEKNADGVIVINHDGLIYAANSAAAQLFAKPIDTLVGMPFGIPVRVGEKDEITIPSTTGEAKDISIRSADIVWDDQPAYLVSLRDVCESKQMEAKIRKLAFYDELTKLPNRRLLDNRLDLALAVSKRSGRYGTLMFLDLDNFKSLNDTHGHTAGDLLLIQAASRLKNCVREVDTVARFGGDEFVLLAGDLDANKAEAVLQAGIIGDKIRAALCEHYSLTFKFDGKTDVSVEHHCTASIGAVMFLGHQDSQVDLYKWADTAMYQAKKAGGNQIRFYMSDSSGNPATQASVREPIAEKRKAEVAK